MEEEEADFEECERKEIEDIQRRDLKADKFEMKKSNSLMTWKLRLILF